MTVATDASLNFRNHKSNITMPALKKSSFLLEASGAFDKNVARRRVDAETSGPVGDCPVHFTAEQAEVWNEIIANVPEGTLRNADRHIVEIVATLMLKFRTTGTKAAELSLLVSCLSKLGCSPYDRSKVAQTTVLNEAENPFKQFT
jgi:hypothetical protein